MLSREGHICARAWEIAEADIAIIKQVRAILDTARVAIDALPDLHGPWPVSGWDATTTVGMLADLTPGKDAEGWLYDHAQEYAREEWSGAR
jgi:hypothetical protein